MQIHLPPTKADGVAVCSRDFGESGPKVTVQEELFPGAWFHHWSEQWINTGYPQGIVFGGDLKRHKIRIVIQKAPEGGVDHDDGTVFWWGAGY